MKSCCLQGATVMTKSYILLSVSRSSDWNRRLTSATAAQRRKEEREREREKTGRPNSEKKNEGGIKSCMSAFLGEKRTNTAESEQLSATTPQ